MGKVCTLYQWLKLYRDADSRRDWSALPGASIVAQKLQGSTLQISPEQEKDLQTRLAALQEEHRDLDSAIAALADQVVSDQLQLQRLKKRKLSLKDQINRLHDQLLPDIIA
jgi:hypothetical protein